MKDRRKGGRRGKRKERQMNEPYLVDLKAKKKKVGAVLERRLSWIL